jgi:hypothetical protein
VNDHLQINRPFKTNRFVKEIKMKFAVLRQSQMPGAAKGKQATEEN